MDELKGDSVFAPFLERRFGEEGIGAKIEELSSGERPTMSLVECAYHMGFFPEAIEAAESVIADSPDYPVARVAWCLKLYAHIALGDGQAAYDCMIDALQACREGLKSDDANLRLASAICAYIIEDCTYLPSGVVLDDLCCLEDLPSGLRAYSGFQMAFRAYRDGDDYQAIGMVRSFLALAGHRYPVSCIKLHLVAASSLLRLGDTEQAIAEFKEAWELARPLGIVAPFVEMSACMPGLARRCLHGEDESSFVLLRTLVMRYRKGWHDLRARAGRPVIGESLSILEYTCATLAVWGWQNRETAQFLKLSENTVKHYLTNAYQKLGVKNRGQLMEALLDGSVSDGAMSQVKPTAKVRWQQGFNSGTNCTDWVPILRQHRRR